MVTEAQSSIELHGLSAAQRLAESVAAVVRPGDVIGLDGDLGAGKTTFVRYLARALGVTAPVTSPTFTLANTYEAGPLADQPLLIHHIDAYRLEGDADAEDLALPELLDSGGIVVVEWAERLTLPADRLNIHFAYPSEPPAIKPPAIEPPAGDPDATGPDTAAPDATGLEAAVPDAGDPEAGDPEAGDLRVATITPQGAGWQARTLDLR